MLRTLSAKKLRAFYQSNIGKEGEVLFESENKEGFLYGFTRNYVRVKTQYDPSLVNKKVMITIGEFDEDGVMKCDLKVTV